MGGIVQVSFLLEFACPTISCVPEKAQAREGQGQSLMKRNEVEEYETSFSSDSSKLFVK